MTDETTATLPTATKFELTPEQKADAELAEQRREARIPWFPSESIAFQCEMLGVELASALEWGKTTHDDKHENMQVYPLFAFYAGESCGAASMQACVISDPEIRGRAILLCRKVKEFVRSQYDCAWSRYTERTVRREIDLQIEAATKATKRTRKKKRTGD